MIDMQGDIEFKDPMVRELCLQQWGHDGHFTYEDASRITTIGVIRESDDPYNGSIQVFDEDEFDQHTPIRYFPELKYFTNLQVIGSYCFAGCDELEEIELPESLKEIRDYAFVFNRKLTRILIPKGVTAIGKRAFACCGNLKEISIPANTSIGVNVFEHCPEDINIARRGEVSYSPDDEIPFADPIARNVCVRAWGHDGRFTYADAAKVTDMGEHRHAEDKFTDTSFVFDEIEVSDRPHCENFNELQYFVNLKNIDSYSFTQCENLKEITLPDSVENIGDMAFVFCTSLERIFIPDSVKNIARWAFRGCTDLEEISLPKGIVLGKGVFDDCSPNLKIVYR